MAMRPLRLGGMVWFGLVVEFGEGDEEQGAVEGEAEGDDDGLATVEIWGAEGDGAVNQGGDLEEDEGDDDGLGPG